MIPAAAGRDQTVDRQTDRHTGAELAGGRTDPHVLRPTVHLAAGMAEGRGGEWEGEVRGRRSLGRLQCV